MSAANGASSYDIDVNKIFSLRLGGAIFGGTTRGVAPGKTMRVVASGTAMRGAEPEPGDAWHVVGAWEEDERYGRQFKAVRTYFIYPSGRRLVPFLASRASWIGRRLAEGLHARLGDKLLHALETANLWTLAEATALGSPASSLLVAAALVETFQAAMAEVAVMAWLDGMGLDGPRLAGRTVGILGHGARARLEGNPYLLAGLVESWSRLDSFAWEILGPGGLSAPRADPRRLAGAVDFTVRHLVASDGCTVLDDDALRAGIARCLRLTPGSAAVSLAIGAAEADGSLLPLPHGKWRAPGCAILEDGLTKRLEAMTRDGEPFLVDVPGDQELAALLDRGPYAVRVLDAAHRETVFRCLRTPVVALSGGTGPARAGVLRAVGYLWQALGGRFEACAPSEQGTALLARDLPTGVHGTVHGLLAAAGRNLEQGSDYGRGPEAQALDARTLLVVDDASTVSLGLWHRLVRALLPGCRLLMAGDADQLPPLGFGLVFHVLARHGRTSACLPPGKKPRAGSLAAVAAGLREGRVPALPFFRGPMDGAYLVSCARAEISDTVAQVVAALGGFTDDHEVQVVAPGAEGIGGSDNLEARFHAAHREQNGTDLPNSAGDNEVRVVRGYHGRWFAVGEPVVIVRNDYDRGLSFGSLGRVEAIRPDRRQAIVRFGGRLMDFGPDSLADLRHAWCLQGSLIQACRPERLVVALYDDPKALDVSWVHTATSRATRQVVFVGAPTAIIAALERPPAWTARVVGFCPDMLSEWTAGRHPSSSYSSNCLPAGGGR